MPHYDLHEKEAKGIANSDSITRTWDAGIQSVCILFLSVCDHDVDQEGRSHLTDVTDDFAYTSNQELLFEHLDNDRVDLGLLVPA